MPGARPRPIANLRRANFVRRREPDHGCAEPAGDALLRRLRVDRRTGRRTSADPRRDLPLAADAGVVRHLVRLVASFPLPVMAFSMEGNVDIAAYTIWADEGDDAAMQDWVTTRFQAWNK